MVSPTAETVRQLCSERRWDDVIELLQRLGRNAAADIMMSLPFEHQQSLFRNMPHEFAAQLLGRFPYFHSYVLLHSRPAPEMSEIVEAMNSGERDLFLDALPEEAWQSLTDTLAETRSARTALEAAPTEAPIEELQSQALLPSHEAIIEARQIEKRYRQPDGREIEVVAPMDLSLEAGTIVALLGPSGCGKSTVLRMLSGLAAPSRGEVLWHGTPMARSAPNVAIVFQSFALFPWLTVLENVESPLLARGLAHGTRHKRALRALDLVGLTSFESAYPKELSGGMKQRVGFARALAVEPEVLFMDEPFSALDVLTAENLRRELLELWLDKKIPTRSIFLVTHNIEESVLLADRIIVLGKSPSRVRADFRVPLAQPRDRKSATFLLYVDYIYKVMTQPELEITPPSAVEAAREPRYPMLPHARPGGVTGLLELLLEHGGEEDVYHIADNLLLEIDDLLPIVEGATLLGFAKAQEGDVAITPQGRKFAEADIPAKKALFRDAALAHVKLLQQIKTALEKKADRTMPLEFFRDFLEEHFTEQEVQRQIETVLNWGRYADIFTYDSHEDRLRLLEPERQAGASESVSLH